MGKMLSGSVDGDFNKPTGRIYTMAGLIRNCGRATKSRGTHGESRREALDLNPNRP